MNIVKHERQIFVYDYIQVSVGHPNNFRRNQATGEWEGEYIGPVWKQVPFSLSDRLETAFQNFKGVK
jgi:hypothetical protein